MMWQDIAKALDCGSKRKIVCCGSSPSALISNNRFGIRFHCFRCTDFNTFIPHGKRSVSEILAARKATSSLKTSKSMPSRAVSLTDPVVPTEAHAWVLQSGLLPEDANRMYGMLYDPFTRRILIPLDNGFLARAVFNERPKYIKSSTANVYELPVDIHTVVVTEDILSAIKVNSVGYSTLAILGTTVSPTIASRIARYKDIIIWTDSDKAGDAAYVKLRKKLALYPVKVRRIVTDDDPKLIHKKTIRKLMETI